MAWKFWGFLDLGMGVEAEAERTDLELFSMGERGWLEIQRESGS
jgi:hypothetical protein